MPLPCPEDKGPAIIFAYYKPGVECAYVQFADRSIIWISPFWDLDWQHFTAPGASPGYWFLLSIASRSRYRWQRVPHFPFGSKKGWKWAKWPGPQES